MSEYVLKHTGKELDMAIKMFLEGHINPASVLMHCTRFASGSYTPNQNTVISDVSIPISEGGSALMPKLFVMFHNSRIENADNTVTTFALTSSVTVADNEGALLYTHSSGIYYGKTLGGCAGQSSGRYFKPNTTGVNGVGTSFYLQGGKQYFWFAWG